MIVRVEVPGFGNVETLAKSDGVTWDVIYLDGTTSVFAGTVGRDGPSFAVMVNGVRLADRPTLYDAVALTVRVSAILNQH